MATKGIILAGGLGSRLSPLTSAVTNKHMLPVGQVPMIYHPIQKLREVNIKDIMVITGTEHIGDIITQLGGGSQFGCNFTYRVQDEPGGIAQALYLCKGFIGHDKMIVILGDNIFKDSLVDENHKFDIEGTGCRLLLKKVKDPERFGCAEIKDKKIVGIEEKPKKPKSDLAVTGIYFYDCRVFDFIEHIKPSRRGELEITDVNNEYINRKNCGYGVLKGWWTDAGTHESYWKANKLVRCES